MKLVEVFKDIAFKISVFVAKFMEPKKRFSSAIVSGGGGQDYRWEGRKKYVAT